jgi:hypothetical protein
MVPGVLSHAPVSEYLLQPKPSCGPGGFGKQAHEHLVVVQGVPKRVRAVGVRTFSDRQTSRIRAR